MQRKCTLQADVPLRMLAILKDATEICNLGGTLLDGQDAIQLHRIIDRPFAKPNDVLFDQTMLDNRPTKSISTQCVSVTELLLYKLQILLACRAAVAHQLVATPLRRRWREQQCKDFVLLAD